MINDQNQVNGQPDFYYTIKATSCSGSAITQSGNAGVVNDLTLPPSNSPQAMTSYPVSLSGFPGLGLAGIELTYQLIYIDKYGNQYSSPSATVDVPQLSSPANAAATIINATTVELSATVGTFPSDATATQGESGIFEVAQTLPFGDFDAVDLGGIPLNSTCAEPISVTDSNLTPDTTYHYRLAETVDNIEGLFGGGYVPNLGDPTDVFGASQTFTTPAVNAPTNTGVSTSTGTGSTTVGCAEFDPRVHGHLRPLRRLLRGRPA